MLVHYIRDWSKRPIGVVVATGPGVVGWSLCNPKDKWDKVLGIEIAVGRAIVGTETEIPNRKLGGEWTTKGWEMQYVKDALQETVSQMIDRSQKYFKSEAKVG